MRGWRVLLGSLCLGLSTVAAAAAPVEFDALTINKYRYLPRFKRFAYAADAKALYRSRVQLNGELIVSPSGNGVNLLTDTVRISIGDFVQVIPASAFRGQRARVFKANSLNSLRKVVLKPTATGIRFVISGSRMRMVTPELVTIQIGDDVGQYDVVRAERQQPARSVIVGQLVDGHSGDGLRGVAVHTSCPLGTCTDTTINGRFRVESAVGPQTLTVDGASALDTARARFSRAVAVEPGTTDVGIIALPAIDRSSGVAVSAGSQAAPSHIQSAVLSTGGTASLHIAAGALLELPSDLSSPQPLTLSEVAPLSIPARMPAAAWGPLVLTAQPEGIDITPCADLSVGNPFPGLGDGATVPLYGFDSTIDAFVNIGFGTVGGGGTRIDAPGVVCRTGWIFPACAASVTEVVGSVSQGGDAIAGLPVLVQGAHATTIEPTDMDGDGRAENFQLPGIASGCAEAPVAMSALARTGGPGFGLGTLVQDVAPVPDGISNAGELELDLATCGEKVGEWMPLLFTPHDFALDADDNIYVANFGNGRVRKLAPDGNLLLEWGADGSGPGQFDYGPLAIAVDANGIVHATDLEPRSQMFDTNGTRLGTLPGFGYGPGKISGRCRMAADRLGNLYVLDGSGVQPAIHKFSPAGQRVTDFATTALGQLVGAISIATGPDNSIYVTTSAARIEQYAADGTLLRGFDTTAAGPGQFRGVPTAITVDQLGTVYAIDYFGGDWEAGIEREIYIKKFDASFSFQLQWGGVVGLEAGQLDSPSQMQIDSHGNVLVLESAGRIQKFAPDGTLVQEIGTFMRYPSSVAVDPAGYVHTRDGGGPARVLTFDPQGTLIARWSTSARQALGVDWQGNVYTANGCALEKYNRAHELVVQYPLPPGVSPEDCTIDLIDADNRGHVYAHAAYPVSAIWKYDDQGTFLLAWTGGEASDIDRLSFVHALAADARGYVYLADYQHLRPSGHRLRKFDEFGHEVGRWIASDVGPGQFPRARFALDADPHGNLYVAETSNIGDHDARVYVYDPMVTYMGHWTVPALKWGAPEILHSITVDGVGNIYMSDAFNRMLHYRCPD